MSQRRWQDLVIHNASEFGPLAVGIDPHRPDLPEAFGNDTQWITRFIDFLIPVIAGQVGFVKFQAAYFEACGLAGLTALSRGIDLARTAGIGVILDAKRGDIDATSAAYSRAYLVPMSGGGSGDFEVDCLTVNPLMGPDTLEPYVEAALQFGKGIFVLCRTSNPGAAWLQDQMAGNHSVSDRLAELIRMIAQSAGADSELSPIGAVIGATAASEARRLRRQLPNSIILAPGIGAQGGDVATIHALQGAHIGDLIVPVSRGLTRIGDRSIDLEEYRAVLLDRIAYYKALVARPAALPGIGSTKVLAS